MGENKADDAPVLDKDFESAEAFVKYAKEQNPNQDEFIQALREIVESVWDWLQDQPELVEGNVLSRFIEPERVLLFRVPWTDDEGRIRCNRGWRVQHSSALGPVKGGTRFTPGLTLDSLKMLALEQTVKDALTNMPLGGGKGGSDFNPKGKSTTELMRFCQSYMTELQRHVGPSTDVPAGDQGCGPQAIGFMFGQYKRVRNEFSGVLTGKDPVWGGSKFRPEATGYGVVYFAEAMLRHAESGGKSGEQEQQEQQQEGDGSKQQQQQKKRGGLFSRSSPRKSNNDENGSSSPKGSSKESSQSSALEGKKVLVSGAGQVAQYVADKLVQYGAKVLTLSDSGGTLLVKDGMDRETLDAVMKLKARGGRMSEAPDEVGSDKCEYLEGKSPWEAAECDVAIPAATQNELDGDAAKALVSGGVSLVVEAANMPCTPDAIKHFQKEGVLFAPGKAANAGGVAVSGLEMSQNAQGLYWSADEVDKKLGGIMLSIHESCVEAGRQEGGKVDYVKGANVAGFKRVALAMHEQGAV